MKIINIKLKPGISTAEAIKAYKASNKNLGISEAKSKVQLLLSTGESYDEQIFVLKDIFEFEIKKTEQDFFYEKQSLEEEQYEIDLKEANDWLNTLSEQDKFYVQILIKSNQVGPACG